jgi:phage tail sheath protein FI
MCAGRGDLFAVLALPERFGADQAIDHAARLQTIVRGGVGDDVPLAPGEERALSYGALYHPWIVTRDAAGALQRTPPDGAACGVMAARAIARGAWVAPANEPLQATVALTRAIPDDRRLELADAAVNLVRRDPRGFMVLAADTLSLDPELRPINVRRLLILIRRVALRHGVRYVFESNDDALRRTVERTFAALFDGLFARGAFAGKTPEQAYRVNCGPSVNPPTQIDLGRFAVELRVAPSLPMSFLTVLLVQAGDGLQVIETSGR